MRIKTIYSQRRWLQFVRLGSVARYTSWGTPRVTPGVVNILGYTEKPASAVCPIGYRGLFSALSE